MEIIAFHMNQKTVVVTVTTHKHTHISLLHVFEGEGVDGAVGEGMELLIRLISEKQTKLYMESSYSAPSK